MMELIRKHFNSIAKEYDQRAARYSYFYDKFKKKIKKTVPNGLLTLEIGCGTGGMLNMVTNHGVGIDSSDEMIKIAGKKFPNLNFKTMPAENITLKKKFEVILMVGVSEHLSDFDKAIENLNMVCKKGTIALITTIHPIYRPLMTWGGRLGLKIDEGDHRWVSVPEIKQALKNNDFRISSVFNDIVMPIKIPLISNLINNSILNRWFGLIQYVTAVKN